MKKKERYCNKCIFSEYVKGPCILASGWKCRLNPFQPVIMGLSGKHADRKQNKKEQYFSENS